MKLNVRFLNKQPYQPIWQAMQQWTAARSADTVDELWILEHFPVYTQGYAGLAAHILQEISSPLIQTDRGGQVTYHGPGQLIIYTLLDLRRLHCHVHQLVRHLEQVVIELLATYQLQATTRAGAPGIYINQDKIGSIGLRIKRGCAYHGLALNVHNDLAPFLAIRPCGLADVKMTSLKALGLDVPLPLVAQLFIKHLQHHLGYTTIKVMHETLPVNL